MKDFDVIIIGAGPVGLVFGATLARAQLDVALVEQMSAATLADPPFDDREIALTHASIDRLRAAGVWAHIPMAEVSPLRVARVWNGSSPTHLQIAKAVPERRPLGCLVANHLIRRAAWRNASAETRLTLFADSRVLSLATSRDGASACVSLHDGMTLRAPLTVSADSRFSTTRRAAGIAATARDFGRTMLVCRMRHAQPHDGVAWEWFDHGQTLALLPLNGGHCSSVVITVDGPQARELQSMTPAQFDADVSRRFRARLGAMQLASERHAYPLVGVHADRFVAHRHALIGDAAVGMHPVTAHGFNLGLLGQATLAQELLRARTHGNDLGAPALLARYDRAHRRAALPMYFGTNALVKIFTAETPPARLARHALLRVASRVAPVRHALAALL